MDPEPTIDAMRTAAQALRSGDARERARAIRVAQDALDAAKALALSELQISRDHELDGASTLNAWDRNELRLNAGRPPPWSAMCPPSMSCHWWLTLPPLAASAPRMFA
ncbi:MAG: hypothetical protein WCB95_02955, partial [Aeromicrobium sp.]